MAVSLDDDVPLILTLDEGESAPLAPSNGLGQEKLPSKSKLVGRWVGGAHTTSARRECETGGLQSLSERKQSPCPSSQVWQGLCSWETVGVGPALQCPRVQCPSRSPLSDTLGFVPTARGPQASLSSLLHSLLIKTSPWVPT